MGKKLMGVKERYLVNSEKGSITLFVLVSMLFLTMFLATIFTLSTNSEVAQREATAKIKEIYEVGVDNIDEVYYELAEVKAYDQYGNEIGDFLENWTYSEYMVNSNLIGWSIKYVGEIDSNTGKIEGEAPYYIRAGGKESYVISYKEMFNGRTDITNLDLSNFKTDKVIVMHSMFKNCSSLTKVNVSSFKTDKVSQLVSMFDGCSSLTELDLTNFNTSSATGMGGMFKGCSNLETININKNTFKTDLVTSMYQMFKDCSSLKEIDVSGFNVQNLNNIESMFESCTELTSFGRDENGNEVWLENFVTTDKLCKTYSRNVICI